MPGQRLGPYEIGPLIGSGGMGDVYRARDTRLERDVAIKVLPDVFTADANRRARFEREARLLAALNHPHIAAIYGFEQRDGIHGLVLELVEGQTLCRTPVGGAAAGTRGTGDCAADRRCARRGPREGNRSPRSEAVQYHDHARWRRQGARLRPGEGGAPRNAAGRVAGGSSDDTREGLVLGSAAYMSPEQARGKRVDKRTDIWAFGCVLYEMLTGRKAFAGETVSDTIAAILERDPDWSVLPETTPPTIRRLLQRCLEKDTKRRLRDIGDGHFELDEPTDAPRSAAKRARLLPVVLWMAAGLIGVGLMVGLGLRFAPRAAINEVIRFGVPAGDVQIAFSMALSPDGRVLVYGGGDYYTSSAL